MDERDEPLDDLLDGGERSEGRSNTTEPDDAGTARAPKDRTRHRPPDGSAPAPPTPLTRLRTVLQTAVHGLEQRSRRTDFVPATETVVLDVRRHLFVLAAPGLRTLAGLVALGSGLRFGPLLLFVLATAVAARLRLEKGLRTTALVAGGGALALIVVTGLLGALACGVLLLVWFAEDVADWATDRLVVTNKRIYRRYGVVTGHSPSISLMAVAYIDAVVPPLGWLLHYGTLKLDSAAQNDAPLSRFVLVPDVVRVSHEILRLRSEAMPRYPQQF